jgi:hypothetical protein
MTRSLTRLHEAGVSVRLDSIGRDGLISGRLARLVGSHHVGGALTDPTAGPVGPAPFPS